MPGSRRRWICACAIGRCTTSGPPAESPARRGGSSSTSGAAATATMPRSCGGCSTTALTDALFLKHVWQRWGYDYRLPDIWPPDPKLGTLEELRALGQLCAPLRRALGTARQLHRLLSRRRGLQLQAHFVRRRRSAPQGVAQPRDATPRATPGGPTISSRSWSATWR